MMKWLEKHLRKYAVRNLSLMIIICYGFGYILQSVNPAFLGYLTLNPYAILHGQIWRLFTWILIPPGSSSFIFVLIAMMFYYSLGTSLENVWGTWRYNVYIFSGLIFTIIGSFVTMLLMYVLYGSELNSVTAPVVFSNLAWSFSTYYIMLSIFLAYAATFPDAVVLLMFLLPVKVKWLGIVDAVIIAYDFVRNAASGRWFVCIAIGCSLLNFVLFFLGSRDLRRLRPSEIKRRNDFKRAMNGSGAGAGASARGGQGAAQRIRPNLSSSGVVHRCAICGKTQADDPTLEFRYCSKCEGTYEFCQDHLFSHIHAKNGSAPAPGNWTGPEV